jgi:DNA replication protein DnaC
MQPLDKAALLSVAGIDSQAIADREARGPIGLEKPPFECSTCEDFLWTHYLDENGLWPKREQEGFGKMVRCPDCTDETVAEAQKARTTQLFTNAGFTGIDVKRFDTFDSSKQTSLKGIQAAELAKRAIVEWSGGGGPRFLVVTGTTGCGKTHLVQGAAASVIERGDPTVFVIWADFVFGLRQKFEASHEYMARLREAEYLVIDEILSARDSTSFLSETLQDLLGHRTHYNKPTILAGNLVAEGDSQAERRQWWVDRVGERFTSRMTDKTMVKVIDMWECDDLRPQREMFK